MTSFAELATAWGERDHRYITRKINGLSAPLDSDEIMAIRWYRQREVNELPNGDRTRAQIDLDQWRAPEIRLR